MPTWKTRMSRSSYILLAIAIIAIITLPLLHITYHAVGFGVDLSFIGVAFMGLLEWAALGPINGALLLGGFFFLGAFTWYMLKKYIIGTSIPMTTQPYTTGYNPAPTQPSQPEQQDETVIT